MQRRTFIAWMGLAPLALAAMKTDALTNILAPNGPITRTISWTSTRAYEPGDVVTLSGFVNNDFNGTYRMNTQKVFEAIA